MSAPLDCPGIECWQALFDDRLAPDQRERYQRHLETCAACQDPLDRAEEVRQFQAEQEEVHQAALSPAGRWLLTAGFDGAVRLWDFATGELLRELGRHNGFAFAVAFAPAGRLAASAGGGEKSDGDVVAGTDHDIRLWDLTALSAGRATTRTFRWLTAIGILFFVLALSLAGIRWYVHSGGQCAGAGDPDAGGRDCGRRTPAGTPCVGRVVALGSRRRRHPGMVVRARTPEAGRR